MGHGANGLAKQGEKPFFALDPPGRALIVVDRDDETRVVVVVAGFGS